MIMIAETAFEMTVHIICESIAGDNFITIFSQYYKWLKGVVVVVVGGGGGGGVYRKYIR